MSGRPSTARAASVVGFFVMISRVLGLLRETLFAYFFGASALASVFINAFRIPNLLRDLFAEGALSTAFVTTFTKKAHQEGETAAWRLANMVFNSLLIILGIIVILGIFLSPQIVEWIAPRFEPENKRLMSLLLQIMFPFILLVSFAALSMGILNTRNIFGVPASASSFFNIGSIVFGFGLGGWLDPSWGARAMIGVAIGVLIGGLLQWLIQAPSLWKVGYRYKPILNWKDPGLREVGILMGPAIIGTAATQVNVLVNTIFANYISEEAASHLYYAFRFLQLPIGVFGVAVGTAMLPNLSRSVASKNEGEFKDILNHSLQLVVFLCLPATIGLWVLGESIVGTIYQVGGKFNREATVMTAQVLSAYAVGLLAYSVLKIIIPAFYALGSSVKPTCVSLAAIGVNLGLNYLITLKMGKGETGLALVTSFVVISNACVLVYLLSCQVRGWNLWPVVVTFLKVCVAAGVMGLSAWGIHSLWMIHIGIETWIQRLLDLGLSMGCCLSTYYLACKLLKISELEDFTGLIKRRLR
ncbi:MAG: murein biosynthesis integral membrane protein MurJ [Verrucomicrobiae bacterium]|nr:murein biosynthesis integral membrane protein MurJ [Verrucomicrobiae bacterium]